jgi:hypothetical protein
MVSNRILKFLQRVCRELPSSRPKRRFRDERTMKPIPYREVDLQVLRAETGFRTRVSPLAYGRGKRHPGSPFTKLEGKVIFDQFHP